MKSKSNIKTSNYMLFIGGIIEWFVIFNHFYWKSKFLCNLLIVVLIVVLIIILINTTIKFKKYSLKNIKKIAISYNFRFFYRILAVLLSSLFLLYKFKVNAISILIVILILVISITLKLIELKVDNEMFTFFDKAIVSREKFNNIVKRENKFTVDYTMRSIFLTYFILFPFTFIINNKTDLVYPAIIIFIVFIGEQILGRILNFFSPKYITLKVYCNEIGSMSNQFSGLKQIYNFKNDKFNLIYEIVDIKGRYIISENVYITFGVITEDIINISKNNNTLL